MSNSAKREKTNLIRVSRVGGSCGLGHPRTRGYWTRLTPSPPPPGSHERPPVASFTCSISLLLPTDITSFMPHSIVPDPQTCPGHRSGPGETTGDKTDTVPAFFKELRGCRERQHIFKCYECYVGTNKALRYQKLEGPNFNQDWKGL